MMGYFDILVPYLQDIAQQNIQYSAAYAVLCRKTEDSFRAFWDSLSEAQKDLYLCFEEDSNAQSAEEENALLRQIFLLTRELYR